MPGDEVTVAQLCGKCQAKLSSFTVKKDNLFLTCKNKIWCPQCGENTPEVRDIAGRLDSIKQETGSYPRSLPANPPRSRTSGDYMA